jgi:hypothetical protein
VVQEKQSLSDIPSGSKSYLVSQHSNPSLVDTGIMPIQYSSNTNPIFVSEASLDHVVSHLVQPAVALMQSSTDTTPVFGGDASLDHVLSHPIEPMVEEVVMSMKSSIDPTLLLESGKSKEVKFLMQSLVNITLLLKGDVSFDHILRISILVPSEQGSIPLS